MSVPFSGPGEQLFFVRVRNDRLEPLLHAGDSVVIDPYLVPKDGQPVIALLPETDEVIARVYHEEKGQPFLEAVAGSDRLSLPQFAIIGAVIRLTREF